MVEVVEVIAAGPFLLGLALLGLDFLTNRYIRITGPAQQFFLILSILSPAFEASDSRRMTERA